MSVSTNTLDHIVHLVPPNALAQAVTEFTELGFRVLPGGTHADGLTSNALVVFKDGSYLELITFNTSSPPATHRWGRERVGWIDWAHLGLSENLTNILNERADNEGSDVRYGPTVPGGRERPDGRVLRWRITAPETHPPGSVPFFCGDVTSREWRVPLDPPSNGDHDNGVTGISYIRLLYSAEELTGLRARLTSVVGSGPDKDGAWTLRTPNSGTPKLLLSAASSDEEQFWLEEKGRSIALYEVGFRAENGTPRIHTAASSVRIAF